MRMGRNHFDSVGYDSIEDFCDDVNQHYNDILDTVDVRINAVIDKLDIKDIDDIYKIAEAYSELKDIATDL
jgi:hypothetical protein